MVSVIIPNYNHAPFLEKRINSVLHQTYKDFELIILDDCSTDNSRDIIELYRHHPQVSHIVYNNHNSGSTFKQWKKGIELSRGEYIWIAESDDWAENFFLEKLIYSIYQNCSSICFCKSIVIDKNNNNLYYKDNILDQNTFNINSKDFLLNKMYYQNSIYNASMVLFKKELIKNTIWEQVNNLRYCGDWLFWAQLLMDNKDQFQISEVDEYLNYFRNHNNNVSNRSENLGLTFIEGFPISLKIKQFLKIKENRYFVHVWFEKWEFYRIKYLFSKWTSLKILYLFSKFSPYFIILEFIRIKKRFWKSIK